jgi:hypothetical protein
MAECIVVAVQRLDMRVFQRTSHRRVNREGSRVATGVLDFCALDQPRRGQEQLGVAGMIEVQVGKTYILNLIGL